MAADLAAVGVPPVADESVAEVLAQPSPLAAFWAAFRENRGAVFGLAVFGLVVVLALAANAVAPYSPIEQFRDAVRAPPVWETGGSWRFILGTDGDGHDMLSRLIYGARVSLFIGFSVMCVSFVIGAVLGLLAAMTGPVVDVAVTRLMDLIMAVPSFVLAILVVAVLGPSLANTHRRGDDRLFATLRPPRPRFRPRRAQQGLRDRRARRRRRSVSARLVDRAAQLPGAAHRDGGARGVRRDSRGGGARVPRPRRSAADPGMGLDARRLARIHPFQPWIVTLPGLAILITVVAINLAGDGLRDALDPKMRRG